VRMIVLFLGWQCYPPKGYRRLLAPRRSCHKRLYIDSKAVGSSNSSKNSIARVDPDSNQLVATVAVSRAPCPGVAVGFGLTNNHASGTSIDEPRQLTSASLGHWCIRPRQLEIRVPDDQAAFFVQKLSQVRKRLNRGFHIIAVRTCHRLNIERLAAEVAG